MSKSSWLLLLGLCASGSALAASAESAFLAQHGLAGKTVEQIVDTIDQTPQSRPLPYSVRRLTQSDPVRFKWNLT
ncbi:hypothetical protein LDE97_003755 [Salmonella enterica]|nr:hypothetical protein [Salmonella enterica]